ncbi:MAG: HD domain-containing phosphohydrolase [Rhodospirillaceae bacterium]
MLHHEHWDGNGYHKRLKEDEFPFPTHIVAVVDAFPTLYDEGRFDDLIAPPSTPSRQGLTATVVAPIQ